MRTQSRFVEVEGLAKTMSRVKRDCPQAEVRPLPRCAHFLQEDCPDEVARLIGGFPS